VNYIGFSLDAKKVTIVIDFPTPKTMINVRAFLGLTGYYKRFITRYAKIVEPFFALMKKDYKFVGMPICQVGFVALKMKLVETPILIRLDFSKPFTLDVNWLI